MLCNVIHRFDLNYLLEGNRLVPPPLSCIVGERTLASLFHGSSAGNTVQHWCCDRDTSALALALAWHNNDDAEAETETAV